MWSLNTDQAFNLDAIGIKSSIRIEQALDSAEDHLIIKVADKDKLLGALQSPANMQGGRGYPLTPARRLATWIEGNRKRKARG